MKAFDQSVSLSLCAEIAWVPLVQLLVEKGGALFGLDHKKALRLVMAAEEIVVHLANIAPGTRIQLNLKPGGWHVLAEFTFTADPSELWAMNIAARSDTFVPEGVDHLGLLLAASMVDGFTVNLEGEMVHLALRQDLTYPLASTHKAESTVQRGEVSINGSPEPALIKAACVRTLQFYPASKLHHAFSMPGKTADMVAADDLSMAVALDGTGALLGMICWHLSSDQAIGFFGPYVFTGGEKTAAALTDHLIHSIARTRAMVLFSELATDDLPMGGFESLGHLYLTQSEDQKICREIWYRHLREDTGAWVWAHPSMVSFLEEFYDHHVLMRDIRQTDGLGERLPRRSVFSATLRPEAGEVSLSPMVTGADAKDCVARHVETLHRKNFSNIFFRLDLAQGWQASLGGVLMDTGFKPRIVLPYGGKSDVVVFQHG